MMRSGRKVSVVKTPQVAKKKAQEETETSDDSETDTSSEAFNSKASIASQSKLEEKTTPKEEIEYKATPDVAGGVTVPETTEQETYKITGGESTKAELASSEKPDQISLTGNPTLVSKLDTEDPKPIRHSKLSKNGKRLLNEAVEKVSQSPTFPRGPW
ncbi:hypothetical protein BC829DRAFT_422479 [Chytridium lagenaria]|nr:hypothetical protein BC829DRAFT_422479 [Chytridium lagenaria]